jgi:hypothetical protein
LPLDLYVGRKLSSFISEAGFDDVSWDLSVHKFQTKEEMEEEYANNKTRLSIAKDNFISILGSEEAYYDFEKRYLESSRDLSNTLFFNKFISWGFKK